MADSLKTLLGVFQSAHYDRNLFRSWLKRHPRASNWNGFKGKAGLKWTPKARFILITAGLISLGRLHRLPQAILSAETILSPVEKFLTWRRAKTAARRLKAGGAKTIIGITGSFGKTTAKEVLACLLAQKFSVKKTPENINTLLGVANWIGKNSFSQNDVVIVEMGAYRRGDIAKIAAMVKPTMAILTGLNAAHRERFGSLEETARAKFEIVDALPRGGTVLWNAGCQELHSAVSKKRNEWLKKDVKLLAYDKNGSENFTSLERRRLPSEVEGDRANGSAMPPSALSPSQAKLGEAPVLTGFTSERFGQGERGMKIRLTFKRDPSHRAEENVCLLGEHAILPVNAAVAASELLGVSREEIARGLRTIRPLGRRLQPIAAPGDRLIIDDSYNITLDGARAAFDFLRTVARRRIGIFAGIPEGGDEEKQMNRELGRHIADIFNIVLLRETPVANDILAGLCEEGFNQTNIIRYNESNEVEAILSRAALNGDCVYFSAYDWPAIYM